MPDCCVVDLGAFNYDRKVSERIEVRQYGVVFRADRVVITDGGQLTGCDAVRECEFRFKNGALSILRNGNR